MNVVGRFAPSPSGYMHMGNLLAMLLAWLDCRALGGELVFRLEDLDPDRSRREYSDALAEDLRWLGLDWDRGWPEADYAQSQRTALYEEGLPDGTRWDKDFYERRIAFYGEALLARYIVNGEFLREGHRLSAGL